MMSLVIGNSRMPLPIFLLGGNGCATTVYVLEILIYSNASARAGDVHLLPLPFRIDETC